ncbi:MAG: helix-turn-helix domain-containing protein [Lachnospiraceae bacterium]|nr:helix-turn-helix domain-containing protein [Lachnospiraceae bacterium]
MGKEVVEYDSVAAGNNIYYFRTQKGITREKLAEAIGIRTQQLGRIERGEAALTVVKLFKLSQILETDPNHILSYPKEDVVEGTVCINDKELVDEISPEGKVLLLKIKVGD